MPAPNNASIGQQLLDVPFPAMIKSMGLAVAEAQFELDRVGLRMAQMMSGKYQIEVQDADGKTTVEDREAYVDFDGKQMSMLELGFTPTFYQFVDTIIEVKISISMSYSSEYKKSAARSSTSAGVAFGCFSAGVSARSSSVSASFASKYQYSAEGSSLLRTKLVPVPPPAVLEERIRKIFERDAAAAAAAAAASGGTP